jgi:hypothetical protein
MLAVDVGKPSPLEGLPALASFYAAFQALPELQGYFAGPLHALPCNHGPGAAWGGLPVLAPAQGHAKVVAAIQADITSAKL